MYRPTVPIWVWGQTRGEQVLALVDAGAAVTVMPMKLCTEGLIDPDLVEVEEEELEAANGSALLVR